MQPVVATPAVSLRAVVHARFRRLVTAGLAVAALSGGADAAEQRSGGGWLLSTRIAFPSNGEANEQAAENGFGDFPTPEVLIGPAADLVIHRFRVGLELALDPYAAEIQDTGGATASVSHAALLASVGFDAFYTGTVSLFPAITFAGTRTSLELTPSSPPILAGPLGAFTDRTSVSRTSFVIGPTLGAVFIIPVAIVSRPGRRRTVTHEGVRVGVEAAYWLEVGTGDWQREGTGLGEEPPLGLGGPQLRVTLGYGTDQADHGSCESACGRVDHALGVCTVSECGFECHSGFGDCDGVPANGCERPLDTLADCGECGEVCKVERGQGTCGNGSCEVATCDPGFANCDGFAITGCEAAVTSDVQHCGKCFAGCAAGERCEAGACVRPS